MVKPKPKPKRPPRKRGRRARIDWAEAKRFYTTQLSSTYEDTAKHVGAHVSTITKRGADEEWPRIREANRQAIIQAALDGGMDNAKELALALRHLEHRESLSWASYFQRLRNQSMVPLPDGSMKLTLSPQQARHCFAGFDACTKMLRLSLGMPTEITATPGEAAESYAAAIERLRAEAEAEQAVDENGQPLLGAAEPEGL